MLLRSNATRSRREAILQAALQAFREHGFLDVLRDDCDNAEAAVRVNEVVKPIGLMDAAMRWCDRISALPPHALPIAKSLLRGATDASWEQAPMMEECAEPMCFTTRGFAEGVKSVVAATSKRSALIADQPLSYVNQLACPTRST